MRNPLSTMIKEDVTLAISAKTLVAVIIFLASGIWAVAWGFFGVKQELRELGQDRWDAVHMERWTYKVKEDNPEFVIKASDVYEIANRNRAARN